MEYKGDHVNTRDCIHSHVSCVQNQSQGVLLATALGITKNETDNDDVNGAQTPYSYREKRLPKLLRGMQVDRYSFFSSFYGIIYVIL